MALLSDEQREELVDMYREAFNDARDAGEERDEAAETALTTVSESRLGDLMDEAWDEDDELREAFSNINATATEDDYDGDYDDEDNY